MTLYGVHFALDGTYTTRNTNTEEVGKALALYGRCVRAQFSCIHREGRHEAGCPHRDWSVEDLLSALLAKKESEIGQNAAQRIKEGKG